MAEIDEVGRRGEPMAPASPQPLMPSGLLGHGVFEVDSWNDGRSAARGMV